MSDGAFYVGYLKRAPRALARFLRPRLALLVAFGAVLATLLVVSQRPFEPGVFEYLVYRDFEGTIAATPYPVLLVERPGHGGDELSQYYLVGFGKSGAGDEIGDLDGRSVRLRGSLIYRGDQTMIEIVPGSVEATAAVPAGDLPAAEDLGEQTLVGEIVDSKCYLGVMKPGRDRTHRACASLCIRGGAPPMLVADGDGGRRHLLLVDERGGAVNDRVLDRVGEPLEIRGRVTRRGTLLYLAADPATYRRWNG